jgi:hypothetical protein
MPVLTRYLNTTQLLPALLLALIIFTAGGCGQTATVASTGQTATATVTRPDYVRQEPGYFRGVIEPRNMALSDMFRDTDRLLDDGFNAVGILPPALASQRAGGQPRVILDGYALVAEGSIDDFHSRGVAVFVSPSIDSPGLSSIIEPTDANLEQLRVDALRWAQKAQDKQVELFAPLCRYNQILGAQAAGAWSANVLPQIKKIYGGEIAAWVTPDPSGPPAAGVPHGFEGLNYHGYDYLLIDVFPQDNEFDVVNYTAYVNDIIASADRVAARDGLKGVMIAFGGWREPAGVDETDGPVLGAEGQAAAAEVVVSAAGAQMPAPGVSGLFYRGWTLPGRGLRDFPVEQKLKELFSRPAGPQ